MKREPARLANERFDLLVVGAGIHGATIASTAAAQGLRVALIDKGDFGHATSSNSQKIIHGGLRYLQHVDLKRMRQSIVARRRLMTVAPHIVRPLRCAVPTRGYGVRSRAAMAAALAINDLVSWDRNVGLQRDSRLSRGHTVSAAECRRMVPGLDWPDLTGGAVWMDAMAQNTERLSLLFVASAAADGACVGNYIEATGYLGAERAARGVTVRDVLSDQTFDIQASIVVNAMGPAWQSLPGPSGGRVDDRAGGWCRAMNLVVGRRLFGDHAVGLPVGRYVDRDAVFKKRTRDLFFAPWGDATIIGTFYDHGPAGSRDATIVADDVHRLLREINSAYPAAGLELSDVAFVHAGLLPEGPSSPRSGDVQLLKHSLIIDAEQDTGMGGMLTVIGVKYTTATEVAERVVRTACAKLGRAAAGARAVPAPGKSDIRTSAVSMPCGAAERLRAYYGPALRDVLSYLETADARAPLGTAGRVLAGQVAYAVQEEMAHKLSDVVFRRTDLGSRGYPGRNALLRCAELMAAELGWTRQRILDEMDEVEQVYSPLFEAGCLGRPRPFLETAPRGLSASDSTGESP